MDEDDGKITVEGINLTGRDLNTILPRQWLNDAVIDAAVSCIYNKYVHHLDSRVNFSVSRSLVLFH